MTAGLAAESFRTAMHHLLASRGHGAQTELAEALSLSRSAINDMVKGRKGASSKMQERIAAYFGLSLGEMLWIGENLLQGGVVFPWADQLDGLPPGKQIIKIVELTNEQVGHPQDNLAFIKIIITFLEGKITPADLYLSYLKMIRSRF